MTEEVEQFLQKLDLERHKEQFINNATTPLVKRLEDFEYYLSNEGQLVVLGLTIEEMKRFGKMAPNAIQVL